MQDSFKPNPSQYSGTTKNAVCSRCNKNLNNLNRIQQDQHEITCKQQLKLFE